MWMSIPQGAKYAHCETTAFRALVMTGEIPSYRSLSSTRSMVSSEDIDAYVRAQGPLPTLPSPACVPARGKAVA